MRRLSLVVGVGVAATALIAGCSTPGSSTIAASSATSSAAPSSTSSSAAPSPPPAPPPEPPAPPPTDALTGGAVNDGPVIAAKIDNTSAGLPQYGIADADVVYIEQVEGGLTRLMAVFHSTMPAEVGPVRSVRTTDAELLPTFGVPALVFSGGGGIPLAALAATSVVAVSEESGAAGFWRSGGAPAPYNLHADLQTIAGATSGLTPAKNIGFVFAATDPRVAAAPTAGTVSVQFQAARIGFTFADGRYQVVRQGDSLTDAGGTPIVADNVLLQNVDFQPDGESDSAGSPSFISHTLGSGTFTLYRDGHAISGTWSRPAPDQPTQFLDDAGTPVPFKPGKTWVALVPSSASVESS